MNSLNKLAILIPTIDGREHFLQKLLDILEPQVKQYHNEAMIIIGRDMPNEPKKTIGEKRNGLMELAVINGCTHRAFIDDDDTVTEDYLELNMPGVRGDYDVNSLVGNFYSNGIYDRQFVHDLKYKVARTNKIFYERFPNHLNVTKIALIKDYKYHHKNFGEDMELAERVSNDGVLKRQYTIDKPVYNYYFRTKHNGI